MLRTVVKALQNESSVNKVNCVPTKELHCADLKVNQQRKEDAELIINVYDEVDNLKSDFEISQHLLASKVGYFAKEIRKYKTLENLNISIHCNINIFEWISCWIQSDESKPETFPIINEKIVISLLNCAINLSINLLVDYLFIYVKKNINNVILNHSVRSFKCKVIVNKLCKYFSNTEIDSIKDKKDKLKSQLYCELIKSLADHVLMYKQGHFSSLVNIFQCGFCGKVLARHLCNSVPCVIGRNFIDLVGNLQSSHVVSKKWNLTKYVKTLFMKLKSWRLVYWRLWGDCHFLHCSACNLLYPLSQSQWCSYHPGSVTYAPMFKELSSLEYPVSCYDCCGQVRFKFDVLKNPNGCVFRPHAPVLNSPLDKTLHKILQEKFNLIAIRPPKYNFNGIHHMTDDKANLNNSFQWYELKPVPSLYNPDSLVVDYKVTQIAKKLYKSAFVKVRYKASVKKPVAYGEIRYDSGSFVSTGVQKKKNPLCSAMKVTKGTKGEKENRVKEMKILEHGCTKQILWHDTSAMENQDNQRSYEEYYFNHCVPTLMFSTECITMKKIKKKKHPSGGTYIRLEREWFLMYKNYLKQKYGITSFAKYHIYNVPWSRFTR